MHRPSRQLARLVAALLCASAAAAVSAASPAPPSPPPASQVARPPPVGTSTPTPPVDVAAADSAFGFRLLNAVQRTVPRSNVVLSPISVALDLSLLLNGAEGETRRQILDVLSLDDAMPNPAAPESAAPADGRLDAINEANARLVKTLLTPVPSITLSVAQSLWVDDRRAMLNPGFIRQAQDGYAATLADLDFSSPQALASINGWASRETHGRIPEILRRIDSGDVAFLLNAVYFKGEWSQKFDKARTQPRDFIGVGGSVKKVPRMAQSGRYRYFETSELQAIRLPFGGGDLFMDIVLPSKTSSLEALEAGLTPARWRAWQTQYAMRPGSLEMPRFDLRSRYRLNQALEALGMTRAFAERGAQFAGMLSAATPQTSKQKQDEPPAREQVPGHGPGPSASFFISSVVQVTDWTVDEDGAEAAAVTSIGVHATAMRRPEPPFSIIVDRPFLCAIEDGRSGALLFVGAVYDPAP